MALVKESVEAHPPPANPKNDTSTDEHSSLHTLPLSRVPLRNGALRRARLVKNSRLEGVVELFAGPHSGSGQVYPDDLGKLFSLDGDYARDGQIVHSLAEMASYDLYSLRLRLRRLGVPVEQHDSLRLPKGKARELSSHMRLFTAPLVERVFGSDGRQRDHRDLLKVFAGHDSEEARRNLAQLAEQLELDLIEIPRYLEEMGDVCLSLAYYQHCLVQNIPRLTAFLRAMRELRQHDRFRDNLAFQRTCQTLERKLSMATKQARNVLDVFIARSAAMWDRPTRAEFDDLREQVTGYQSAIGGALCAITVKMNAWSQAFGPDQQAASAATSPIKRADFIMNEMRPGLEAIELIR